MLKITIENAASFIPEPRDGLDFLKRIRQIEALEERRLVGVSDLFDLLFTSGNSCVLLESESLISKHSRDWNIGDNSLSLELAKRLEKSVLGFQREVIYRALIPVIKRGPRIAPNIVELLEQECAKDHERPVPIAATIQLPFGIKLPASDDLIVARLAGEALDRLRGLADTAQGAEALSHDGSTPLTARPLNSCRASNYSRGIFPR